MTHITAMKQALEALEVASSCVDGYYIPKGKTHLPEVEKAITSLKQAIAEAEKREAYQKPVAWMSPSWIDPDTRGWQSDSFESIPIQGWLPVYTFPPQRKPLTDEELEAMAEKHVTNCYFDTLKFARAIEAAHGIKGEA